MDRTSPRCAWRKVPWILLLAVGTGCGGAGGATARPPTLQVSFTPARIAFAVEARLQDSNLHELTRASFTVRTKPGNFSRDVHVTLARSFLDRTQAFDADGVTLRIPVFGLYASYANEVVISLEFQSGDSLQAEFTVQTGPGPDVMFPIEADVELLDPNLDFGFLSLQGYGSPAILDVDGELRWLASGLSDRTLPRARTPEGFVVGSLSSTAIVQIDWLGRTKQHTISDACYTSSHHNLAPGKTGLLNTNSYRDDQVDHPLSVLLEMTPTGTAQRAWDFSSIFRQRITSLGESPVGFIDDGHNWFHMNSAIYCAADDSILVSSRENFVVKADHATGEIRWLLGNSGKDWYRNFPLSLQPLTLAVIGDPPIGQHSLSLSADGQHLMLFNNGLGNLMLPDVGDSRTSSTVSIYRIDEGARTAEEVWSFEHDPPIYSPICSSAYWTASHDVLVVYSAPMDGSPPRLVVVSEDKRVLYEATLPGPGCSMAYAAEELRLDRLLLD